jgi:hypothetical protein
MLTLLCQALIDTLEGGDNPLAGVALDVHWEVRIRAKQRMRLHVHNPTCFGALSVLATHEWILHVIKTSGNVLA